MARIIPWVVAGTLVVGVVAAGVAGWRLLGGGGGHYEEPDFTVEASHEGFEVRRYAPTLEARVTLPGSREQATQAGFRVLAGYIFGGNQGSRSIDMTTPVSAAPAEQRIDMTAPVTASPEGSGWTVAFTMPSEWTLDSLPVPDDDRIELVEVPGRVKAVRTFSGRATTAAVRREQAALDAALKSAGLTRTGGVTVAQFDPPWVLGPWRRNEIMASYTSA